MNRLLAVFALSCLLSLSGSAQSTSDPLEALESTFPVLEAVVSFQENLNKQTFDLVQSKLQLVLPSEQQLEKQKEMGTDLALLIKEASKSLKEPPAPKKSTPEGQLAPEGGRTLHVQAYAYALRGRTASGRYTEPGIVAVDPRVIPLGSKLYIPGYGWGIAADTGGAIIGNKIDVWFPTTAQCFQWGVRPVTIQVFPKGS